MHFDLNLKSLTMSGSKYPFSFISAHSTHFHFSLPRNGHQTAARHSSFPPPLRLGGLGERLSSPSGSGRSPAAKRILCICGLKMKSGERLSSLSGSGQSLSAAHALT